MAPLPDSPTIGTNVNLSGIGKIYVAPASMTVVSGWTIGSNGIAVVVPQGRVLSLSSSASANCGLFACLVYGNSVLFNWI